MEKVRLWLRSQWNDIKGSFKFWIFTYLFSSGTAATLLTSGIHHIQILRGAPQQDRLGYLILGILIFLAFLFTGLLYFLAKRSLSWGIASGTSLTGMDHPQAPSNGLSTPKEVDVFTDPQQLHFRANPNEYTYTIFMKLKLTNRGPVSATIESWQLFIKVGAEVWKCEASGQLPENLAVRRLGGGLLAMSGSVSETFEQIDPDLADQVSVSPLVRGIPQQGWVCFHVPAWNDVQPAVNARLELFMVDSLGGYHWHVREPANYVRSGEIVEHQKPAGFSRAANLLGGG